MWTIGVTKTGNELGLTLAEVEALPPDDVTCRLQSASRRMLEAGAHFTVEEVRQLPAVIAAIGEHLTRGEKP
jgi:phosphonoacetaldehyde hydrolase